MSTKRYRKSAVSPCVGFGSGKKHPKITENFNVVTIHDDLAGFLGIKLMYTMQSVLPESMRWDQ